MASALKTAEILIKQRFGTLWAGLTTVAYPNVDFTPPADKGTWVRLSILWGDGDMETMGSGGLNRVVGVVQLSVFAKKGIAQGDRNAKLDAARDVFNRVSIAGPPKVEFGAPSGLIAIPDAEWDGAAVRVPFDLEETV